jgi:carbamoyltransferase
MRILGLSYGFHDSAAALVDDGHLIAAVEEERLSRRKHDASFPERAAEVCLAVGEIEPADIDLVAFHEKPIDVLDRHLRTRLRAGPRGLRSLLTTTPEVVRDQLGVPAQISKWFRDRGAAVPPVRYLEHHLSHAAAAFYPSPFEAAAVLTIDGVGEHATSTVGSGQGSQLRIDRELRFPDSVGLLYSAFTSYCGFRVNSGEGELMGLAPFGEPVHYDTIRSELLDVHDDGSIHLDQRAFALLGGRRMTSRRFHELFGGPPRPLGAPPGRREADLAASIQAVLEDIVLRMADTAHEMYGSSALCVGGGVALNCVANGRLLREGPFEQLWIQPACGDAGSAIGAALWAWHALLGNPRRPDPDDGMAGGFLGPSFTADEVQRWLRAEGVPHEVVADADERCRRVAERLDRGEVVGWFTGRLEFGPRALGHRSILADPRSPTVQGRINSLVKERAAFRPFAPAVLADRAAEWFDLEVSAPYMNIVSTVRKEHRIDPEPLGPDTPLEEVVSQVRSSIPAVTHVDGSARVQTVDRRRNPAFAALLEAFEERTGCPVLLNTSFNTRDEPIVCTPADALATHRRASLDLVVIEDCLVEAAR